MGKHSSKGTLGTQSNNSNARVGVRAGSDRDSGKTISEFIVADKGGKEHHHIGIDKKGNEVFHGIRSDKKK